MAGNGTVEKSNYARTPFYNNPNNDFFWSRNDLPIPERINLYNTKYHYFTLLVVEQTELRYIQTIQLIQLVTLTMSGSFTRICQWCF
jgi:hypothetical protein